MPFTTVAERLKPESLYERFVAFREGLGMEVLPLTGGTRPPFDVLRERLGEGGTVCLLGDRDLTPRGVDVQFFGAAARMPAGPARLALETGADLIPCALSFTDTGWAIAFDEPLRHTDVATMTQQLASAFEAGIAEHPQDWHMLQLLWLDDLPDGDPRKAPLSVRVGLVCPYTFDVPGGVQAHVKDLAECLIGLGHEVSVLAPVDDPDAGDLPPFLVPAGRAIPVPYNGSVARLVFGPVALARTRRWLRKGSVRRAAPARADGAVGVDAGAVRGPRSDRRDLPHGHRAQPRARGVRHGAAAGAGEDQRPDRGLACSPPSRGGAPGP